MTNIGYALARAELIHALTAYTGIATSDGATPANNTIVDANLIGSNDFITEKSVIIMSGPAAYEDKGAASFVPGTGTITLQSGFSAQITAGTIFRILNISSVEIDVANIKDQTDKLAGQTPVEGTVTANWNTATGTSGEAGEDLVTLGVAATRYKLHSLLLDVLALTDGALINVKLFMKVNGNERKVYDRPFTVPTTAAGETPPPDTLGLWIVNGTIGIHDTLRVEVYSNTNENVAIGYTYMLEEM